MTSIYHQPINFSDPATSSLFNLRLGQLDSAIDQLRSGTLNLRLLNFGASTHRQIVGGQITVSQSHHTISPEAGITDDLETILGGSEGYEVTLRLQNSGDSITLKHNTGNIYLSEASDFTLDDANRVIKLFFNPFANKWTDIGSAGGGGLAVLVPYTVLGADVATLTIPTSGSFLGAYSELEITLELRTDRVSPFESIDLIVNGDTGANYNYDYLSLFGGTVLDTQAANQTQLYLDGIAATGATAAANRYGGLKLWIPGYARTDREKKLMFCATQLPDDTSADWGEAWGTGVWKDTAAITSIRVAPRFGTVIVAGSAYAVWAKA